MPYRQNPYVPLEVYTQQQQLAKGDLYAQLGADPSPQQPYAQPGLKMGNPWASRALYSGIVSLALSLVTLYSLVGFAGLITGTFAIIRGVAALNRSKRLPGNVGRARAVVAIAMGALAWVLVLLSFALRSAGSY